MPFTPDESVTAFGIDVRGSRSSGFDVKTLFSLVNTATMSAKAKLLEIQSNRSAINIGDMFEMQMLMNHLSQLSEMSTSVVSASHAAISSMARNVKG
ncbi:MAG: DUF5407 family protein [Waddliaceae bacterium]